MLASTGTADAVLAARCAALSETLYRDGRYAKHSGVSLADQKVLAQSAVFLAFIALGGDVDRPDAFAWDTQAAALRRIAQRHLRRDLIRTGSDTWDESRREAARTPGAMVEQFRWDAWTLIEHGLYANVARRCGTRVLGVEVLADEDALADEAALADALTGLHLVLERKLRPSDWTLLRDYYIEGTDAPTICAARGFTYAAFKQALHRARQRAARALVDWRAVAV